MQFTRLNRHLIAEHCIILSSLLAGGGAQLTVGILIAETGQGSYLGKVVRAGMEKAVQDIETLCSKEGCLCINPVYQDTQSSAQTAVQQFTSMYNQGIRIFAGLVTSEEAKAVAEYASQHATDALLVVPQARLQNCVTTRISCTASPWMTVARLKHSLTY